MIWRTVTIGNSFWNTVTTQYLSLKNKLSNFSLRWTIAVVLETISHTFSIVSLVNKCFLHPNFQFIDFYRQCCSSNSSSRRSAPMTNFCQLTIFILILELNYVERTLETFLWLILRLGLQKGFFRLSHGRDNIYALLLLRHFVEMVDNRVYTRQQKAHKVKHNVSQSTSGCELTTAPVNTPTPPLSILKYIFVHNFFGKTFFDIIFSTDYTSHFIVSIQ